MKTTILQIVEIDTEVTSPTGSREIARVEIPPVAEPLKLLVSLLQTVDAAGKPKKPRKQRADAGKSRTNGTGVTA